MPLPSSAAKRCSPALHTPASSCSSGIDVGFGLQGSQAAVKGGSVLFGRLLAGSASERDVWNIQGWAVDDEMRARPVFGRGSAGMESRIREGLKGLG